MRKFFGTSDKKVDLVFLTLVLLLLFFGLIMLSSAGVVLAKTRFGDEYYFFKRQLLRGVLPGLFLLWIVSRTHFSFWRKIALPFFVLALFFLLLVFIPGVGVRLQGASRWVNLGFFSFQPTEMMKLALIVYLALWIANRKEKIKQTREGFLPFVGIFSLVALLVIKQPDIGTLGAITFFSLTMFFLSGSSLQHLALMILGGFFLVFLLIKIEPYRMNRLLTFLNPEHDVLGVGYQINQARLAIGVGGLWGLGLGHSRQKFNYLPEPVGDSIFALVAEETGLIGASLVILVFLLLALRGYKIARLAPDNFSALLVAGITSWIIFQALINIMAIVGLIPLTGVPLPFISYGSTSLVFLLIGVGIVLNISRYKKEI